PSEPYSPLVLATLARDALQGNQLAKRMQPQARGLRPGARLTRSIEAADWRCRNDQDSRCCQPREISRRSQRKLRRTSHWWFLPDLVLTRSRSFRFCRVLAEECGNGVLRWTEWALILAWQFCWLGSLKKSVRTDSVIAADSRLAGAWHAGAQGAGSTGAADRRVAGLIGQAQ